MADSQTRQVAKAETRRQGSCSSPCRGVCTCILVFVWLLLAFGVLLSHLATQKVVPELQDLPENMQKGFNDILKFDSLESEALVVQEAAEEALAKCDIVPTQCDALPPADVVGDRTSDTTQEKEQIEGAFSRALNDILKVATDPIFGTDGLNSTAVELQKIIDDLNSIDGTNAPCIASNALYCDIRGNSLQVSEGASEAEAEIDKFSNTEQIQKWQEYGENLKYMHLFPYVFVLAIILFTLFWWKDAACIGCGGSCVGFVLLILFSILYISFFAFAAVIVVTGYMVRNQGDKIPINGVFREDVSLKEILDHIQTDYPAFWNTVFANLVEGLELLNAACLVFVVVCFIVLIYGLSVCACRPYTDKQKASLTSGSVIP